MASDSVRGRVAALEQQVFARQARKVGASSNGVDSYCFMTDPLASSYDSAENLDDASGDILIKEEVPSPTEDAKSETGSVVCRARPVPPFPERVPQTPRLQYFPKVRSNSRGCIPAYWDELLEEEDFRSKQEQLSPHTAPGPPPQSKASTLSAQPPTERTYQAEQPPAMAGCPRLRVPISQQQPPTANSQQRPPAQCQPVVIPMTQSGAEDLEDIQLGGCAFADEGGYEPDHLQAPPVAAYGGDGSAQRLQAIVSTAAKKARMVMMGGNDAEILTIAARVASTGPCAPRSPPGPPPQKLRQWQQCQPQAQPCTEPWHHWSPATPADPDDLWENWHGTHKRGTDNEDSDDKSVMAHTDVGDYRHAREPAPTFISMAAPLNAKG